MSHRYPIQRIRHFICQERRLLAATAGPGIQIFDAGTGVQLSSWPPSANALALEPRISPDQGLDDDACGEPAGKRRKLSPPFTEGEEAQVEKGVALKSTPSGKSRSSRRIWFTIPILIVSGTGDHIIAVTGEDKCLRVFEIKPDGAFTQLSERFMPKRPCAVTVTPDNTTILCGDKFGDVYSLPLLPEHEATLRLSKSTEPLKSFQPSATKLTVHTQRNLKALEQQLRKPHAVQEKSEFPFEHRLLLGHVSMLTDMALVHLPAIPPARSRSYIITSDRDEHIRVSRGPSQAHIIHGYCLGHTSFVSKLCIPPWDSKVLISGGGDDCIFCWDWLEGRILQRVPLEHGNGVLESRDAQTRQSEAGEKSVSGIWAISFADRPDVSALAKGGILVALEGVPKLLWFSFGLDGSITARAPIELSGNALDVTAVDRKGTILVSVDNIHSPGTTNELRDSARESPLLQCYFVSSDGEFTWNEGYNRAVETINTSEATDIIADTETRKQVEALSGSLYGVENLRKWVRGDRGEDG
ncbi:tRNA (guanine-N(7)-)-methyltransferase non-catalytic subunit trm82 [Emydomyces testavorans]|uniref:tRNA (Guanine-N(7)-)-methyltransferase non-catalytic subunit trm82 n=1 Tax=Emydomyces testavorans TaxID=2070801 RepID=A0AAF0IIU7_9EURO|nr:tRNA (guanine-N(7)-)-methyltransferase non-catalytic subunit trm82 [Emydomyces testavorans]